MGDAAGLRGIAVVLAAGAVLLVLSLAGRLPSLAEPLRAPAAAIDGAGASGGFRGAAGGDAFSGGLLGSDGVVTPAEGAAPDPADGDGAPRGVVVVRPGDTLWSLARRLVGPAGDPRPLIEWILEANDLSSSRIRPGQMLAVPQWFEEARTPAVDEAGTP